MLRTASIFMVVLFLLTACSDSDADQLDKQYSGESDQWEVNLHVKDQMEFKLLYREDPVPKDDIHFTIESVERGFGGSDYRLNEEGFLTMHTDWSFTDSKEETIEVTVEWDGHRETILLKKE